MTVSQTRFRFRTDTAAVDTAATWAAAENVNWSPSIAQPFRLRMTFTNNSAFSGSGLWYLSVSRNGGAYTQITSSSTYVQLFNSSASADGASVTVRQLTADSGNWQGGEYEAAAVPTTNYTIGSLGTTEWEFGLVLTSACVLGDTLDFRVAGFLGSYVTPRITVTNIGLAASDLPAGAAGIGTPVATAPTWFALAIATAAAGIGVPTITGVTAHPAGNNLAAGAARVGPATLSLRIALPAATNLATQRASFDQAQYSKNAGVQFVGEQWTQRFAADYTIGFNGLLPTGPAWPRDPAEPLQLMVAGLAQVWGDVVDAEAALLLVTESDPRKTNMLLPDWERNFGLPDNCLPFPPTTIPARETALVQKMTLFGGQSKAFFTSQANILGQSPVYEEYAPYMCGVSRVGDTRYALPHYSDDPTNYRWMLGPKEIRFYWKVTITNVLTGVECIINRYKPTQTDAVFVYTSVLDRSSGVYTFLGF